MTARFLAPQPVADHALRLALAPSDGPQVPSEAATEAVRAALAALLAEPLDGVRELVPGYASILICFEPLRVDPESLSQAIVERLSRSASAARTSSRFVEVPVCYGGEYGPDLEPVAAQLGLTPAEVIARHSDARYQVAFLGFAPGFPYLLGLPPSLHIPRRATPRLQVPAGAVAIAGAQAGIYPQDSPGGWQLLGRTPLSLLELGPSPRARLQLGDTLRFRPIAPADFVREAPPPLPAVVGEPALSVRAPGVQTTVQDLGRPGLASLGISVGGAADGVALRLANALLQNPDSAAALELTLGGPELLAECDLDVALVGLPAATVDGLPLTDGASVSVRRGQVLRCGPIRPGLRGYLAVRGGLSVPRIAGSAATDLRGQLGGLHGRALRRGDVLLRPLSASGLTGSARRLSAVGWALLAPRTTLRVTWGAQADWFASGLREHLSEQPLTVSPQSSRTGLRLQAAEPFLLSPYGQAMGSLLSEGVTAGALQVPGDGQPILLGVEQAATGGYPKLAHVISADLPLIGRLRPGQTLSLSPVSLPEALAAYRSQERALTDATEPVSPTEGRSDA